ncbi:PREDICTED: C-C chemokine receptor type 1-like [Poecilia mexicana]|uniref:G-protein coupled receptors family 1 profile domain-containing protein n=1 Tax=Poecilia mexicana TaxID=48701 RepID=A0A3B3XUC0_9TELE|nr:PREDICTED: C-C chemokine receptor type 1-like [Poecilia mexicana]
MANTTTPSYDYDSYSDLPTEPKGPCDHNSSNLLGAQISVLYYFMFAFSLLGNGLVLIIIYRFERLTTVTNIMLLNLVASSLIFMSSLPFVAVYMQISEWIFGSAMCKIVFSAYYMGFYSSVFFLTLLTFDRHLSVVYSLTAAPVRNQRYAVISCVAVWLVSGLACIRPMLIMNTFRHYDHKIYCEEYPRNLPKIDVVKLTNAGFYIQLFVFLILPLAVIIYCYIRITITVISSRIATKFKTVRLIFVIVLMFFICWTPFNIVELLHGKFTSCEGKQRHSYALQVTRNMAYFYFCISPMFYTFVGRKFQNYFRHLVVSRFPTLKKYISVAEISRNNTSTKVTGTEVSDGRGSWSLLRHQTDNMTNQHGNI